MADAQIDRYPIKDLPGRYEINRSVLYSRLKALSIHTQQVGKQSFVTGNDLELLDRLHQHLQRGGITSEFLAQQTPTGQQQDKSPDNYQTKTAKTRIEKNLALPDNHTRHSPDTTRQDSRTGQLTLSTDALEALVQNVAIETADRLIQQKESADPLADLEVLQRLADNSWTLPTSRLAAIVGLSPSTLSARKEFYYCGFTISKAGKQGNQIAWRVSKD